MLGWGSGGGCRRGAGPLPCVRVPRALELSGRHDTLSHKQRLTAPPPSCSPLPPDVPVTGADVQGGKTMIHTISEVLIPPSLLAGGAAPAPVATKDVPVETKGAPAVTNGAASVAAGLLLAVPAAIAALL